jgi:ribosomal protein L29
MKQQDVSKFHQQTISEINTEVTKLEKQLIDSSMKKSLAQLKNVRLPKTIRHNIARLKSIIRIKELATKQESK